MYIHGVILSCYLFFLNCNVIVSILLVIDYIHYCILLAVPTDMSNATVSGLIDGINKYKYRAHGSFGGTTEKIPSDTSGGSTSSAVP